MLYVSMIPQPDSVAQADGVLDGILIFSGSVNLSVTPTSRIRSTLLCF